MTDSDVGEVASLLQTLTAMVQMQAESVRLQRLLVERLLGQAAPPPEAAEAAEAADSAPSAAEQNLSRGARYYQPRGAPSVPTVTPQQVDLLCRLQEIRDAGDLILQFGPHKGTTLAQLAVHHPDYIRELLTHAQRPAVRAAAARIVEALEASAPPKRRRRALA